MDRPVQGQVQFDVPLEPVDGLPLTTDPVFEGDPDKNFTKDPLIQSRELVRPVRITGDPKAMYAAVNFELCMERL